MDSARVKQVHATAAISITGERTARTAEGKTPRRRASRCVAKPRIGAAILGEHHVGVGKRVVGLHCGKDAVLREQLAPPRRAHVKFQRLVPLLARRLVPAPIAACHGRQMSAQKARRPRRASAAAGARGRNTTRRPTTQQRQGSLESSHPPDTPTTMLGQNLRDAGKNARASAEDAQIAAHVHVLCSARGRAWALRKARRAHPLHNNTQLASHHCIQPVGIGSKVRPGLGGYERREEPMRPPTRSSRQGFYVRAPRLQGSWSAGARAQCAQGAARARNGWRTRLWVDCREPGLQLHRRHAWCARLHHLGRSAVQRG